MNILPTGDEIAGAVDILCRVDGNEGLERICVRVGIIFIFHLPTPTLSYGRENGRKVDSVIR